MDPKHKGAQAPPEARVLLWEGEPVLSFFPPKVTLPLGMPKRVTAYYRRLEQMWRDRWEKTVYFRACAAAQAARDTSRPFDPCTAGLEAEAEKAGDILRVRWEAAETAGGRRCALNREELWQLPKGTPVIAAKGAGKKHQEDPA